MARTIEEEISWIIAHMDLEHEWSQEAPYQCACGQYETDRIDDANSAVCEVKLRALLMEFAKRCRR